MISVLPSAFHEVLPVWRQQLWLNRHSEILPNSAIGPNGTVDLKWLSAKTFFYKIEQEKALVGVISALQLGASVRARGLWVDPNFRSRGFAKLLLGRVETLALEKRSSVIWTMARESALTFYTKNGYLPYADVEGYEYGPHRLCRKECASC